MAASTLTFTVRPPTCAGKGRRAHAPPARSWRPHYVNPSQHTGIAFTYSSIRALASLPAAPLTRTWGAAPIRSPNHPIGFQMVSSTSSSASQSLHMDPHQLGRGAW
jgi:hypothetical protein